ncbi:hypothetical protein LC55x_2961 [Lysobacter capsici]|uniref:XVIPCD domain-containing protein n=1 Tax=Lysobacter capsici TaxID=435897 RepID=UPI00071677DC|nr:XVIPCD domain-containing protein [Lysobacter capsici]ALN86226.1 hypothetical protein LC55x_2961 [Lysobacter capsici]
MNANPPDQHLGIGTGASSQTLDDMRRGEQRNLLSSPSHPQHDLFSTTRVCLDKQEMARQYSSGERDNLAAALALEAARGHHGVDHVVFSKDGARAFAVEGDPDSPSRRMSYVDAHQAASQSMQRSSEQFAQLNREQDLLERQREQEQRQGGTQAQQQGERNEREQSAPARSLFKDKD